MVVSDTLLCLLVPFHVIAVPLAHYLLGSVFKYGDNFNKPFSTSTLVYCRAPTTKAINILRNGVVRIEAFR